MGLLEFNKLPINTLVGADWKTFKAITAGREIDAAYKGKYRLTKAVCRLLSPLASLQDKRYEKLLVNQPLEHDPVFILGHWRSGTTFVHNVFSCDKHFGYNTTYQTVFPHLMMWGQPFFKKNMSWLMPDKRPTDNMELAVDLPQEEEFALANMMPYTYYNFWFLPKYQQEYADKYLLFDNISDAELKVFEEVFTKLIKISLWNTHGTQFLSKNPPHTGRVRELVKMFPNAKFIYLMRNPYTVFESTRSFFTNTIQPLKLQEIYGKQLSLKSVGIELEPADKSFAEQYEAVVKTHLSNPELDVEMLCKEMGVSRAKLYRKVKAITNLSPAELIRNIRLECAAEMLRTSQQTATEIAYQTGFGSYNHFGDYFKSVYGVSPKVYKEKYKNT